ncbi:hypothetical protein [Oscillatoria sp. HE19RPO]|uniref:hypothetical protein n=1 Tax=Oscillatoria sp. HE19RPO TaxID=2954806 RepID=UPI0020C35D3E|nr:hypothetical protein [Oscillatoria sp. HE19RPO]
MRRHPLYGDCSFYAIARSLVRLDLTATQILDDRDRLDPTLTLPLPRGGDRK